MILVLCLLAALMLLPYVVGPFVLRRQFRHRIEPELVSVEPGAVPEDALAYLRSAEASLLALGFEARGRAQVETVTCVRAWISVCVHPIDRTLAQAAAVAQVIGGEVQGIESRSVEFLTSWGRRSLLTNNAKQLMPFGPVRGQSVVRVGDLDDVSKLYQIHMARVAAEGSAASTELPSDGQELHAAADAAKAWAEAQVARGLMAQRDDETYGLTWRGAIRATWKHAWPFRGLEMRRARAAAARLVKTLDLDVPAAQAGFVGTPTPAESRILAEN